MLASKAIKSLTPKLATSYLELSRFNNLSFQRLTASKKQEVLHLLAQQFSTKQPLTQALYRAQPERKVKAYENQLEFWNVYIDQCIESGLSVIVVDLEKNSKVVATTISKDYAVQKPEYQELLVDGHFSQITDLILKRLYNEINFEKGEIFEKQGNVVEMYGAAVLEGYTGMGLLRKMLNFTCELGQSQGYEHACTFATNYKSTLSLSKLGFSKMAELNVREFRHKGVQPFKYIEKAESNLAVWFKNLH